MDRSAPAKSLERPPPSAVAGLAASRAASGPSKCTSPPKARVTALPLPLQPGDSGEPLAPVVRPAGVVGRVPDECDRPPALPALAPVPRPGSVQFLSIRTAAASTTAIIAAQPTIKGRLDRRLDRPQGRRLGRPREECTATR